MCKSAVRVSNHWVFERGKRHTCFQTSSALAIAVSASSASSSPSAAASTVSAALVDLPFFVGVAVTSSSLSFFRLVLLTLDFLGAALVFLPAGVDGSAAAASPVEPSEDLLRIVSASLLSL